MQCKVCEPCGAKMQLAGRICASCRRDGWYVGDDGGLRKKGQYVASCHVCAEPIRRGSLCGECRKKGYRRRESGNIAKAHEHSFPGKTDREKELDSPLVAVRGGYLIRQKVAERLGWL